MSAICPTNPLGAGMAGLAGNQICQIERWCRHINISTLPIEIERHMKDAFTKLHQQSVQISSGDGVYRLMMIAVWLKSRHASKVVDQSAVNRYRHSLHFKADADCVQDIQSSFAESQIDGTA